MHENMSQAQTEYLKTVIYGPVVDMRMSLATKANYNECDVAVKFAQKGFRLHTRVFSDDNDFSSSLLKSDGKLLLLFTNQVQEFDRLNRLAQENNRQSDALIIWHGHEKNKPEAQSIPVLSTEILFENKDRIEMNQLYVLAQQDHATKKSFWKKILPL